MLWKILTKYIQSANKEIIEALKFQMKEQLEILHDYGVTSFYPKIGECVNVISEKYFKKAGLTPVDDKDNIKLYNDSIFDSVMSIAATEDVMKYSKLRYTSAYEKAIAKLAKKHGRKISDYNVYKKLAPADGVPEEDDESRISLKKDLESANDLSDEALEINRFATGPTVSPTGPTVSPTGPTGSPTGPTVSPTGPTVSPTGPTVSPTGPTVSPTGPTVSPTGPTVSPTGPTVSPTGPTVSPTGPTGSPTGPTGSRRSLKSEDLLLKIYFLMDAIAYAEKESSTPDDIKEIKIKTAATHLADLMHGYVHRVMEDTKGDALKIKEIEENTFKRYCNSRVNKTAMSYVNTGSGIAEVLDMKGKKYKSMKGDSNKFRINTKITVSTDRKGNTIYKTTFDQGGVKFDISNKTSAIEMVDNIRFDSRTANLSEAMIAMIKKGMIVEKSGRPLDLADPNIRSCIDRSYNASPEAGTNVP